MSCPMPNGSPWSKALYDAPPATRAATEASASWLTRCDSCTENCT